MLRIVWLVAVLQMATCEMDVTALSSSVLDGRIGKGDQRYSTWVRALDLIIERDAKVIVETGTARYGDRNCGGDGCSTVLLSHLASFRNRSTVYSVDISGDAIEAARQAVTAKGYSPFVQFIVSDSIQFLKDIAHPIDFLYLDSYDFDCGNPGPSQQHHLSEIQKAIPHLHARSVVMLDDCRLPHGGKCRLVKSFLKERGWVPHLVGYQEIWVVPDTARADSVRGYGMNK